MKKDYQTNAHAKHRLRYHIIFSTKYRQKCLNMVKEQVLESFRYGEGLSDYQILTMNLEDDHIHFLMKWKSSLSIDQVVRRMKQTSTSYLWDNCYSHFNKIYWGTKHIWTGGYFCSTIGDVSESNIIEYIQKQG